MNRYDNVKRGEMNVPGTWNHTVRAKVRLASTICDHNRLPSLYRSKLEVVRYDMTKPNTVPTLVTMSRFRTRKKYPRGTEQCTYTVSSVLWMARSYTKWLIKHTAAPHAVKNIRICQHRKSAVASNAFTKEPIAPLHIIYITLELDITGTRPNEHSLFGSERVYNIGIMSEHGLHSLLDYMVVVKERKQHDDGPQFERRKPSVGGKIKIRSWLLPTHTKAQSGTFTPIKSAGDGRLDARSCMRHSQSWCRVFCSLREV